MADIATARRPPHYLFERESEGWKKQSIRC